MSKKKETISIRSYAEGLKVDEKAVRDAIKSGLIKKGVAYTTKLVKGKKTKVPAIVKDEADKEWGFKHETIKPRAGVSIEKALEKLANNNDESDLVEQIKKQIDFDNEEDLSSNISVSADLSYREAIRLQLIVKLALDKKDLREKEGSLVKKDKVEKALYKIGSELKAALHNMGIHIARDMMAAPNEVEALNIYRDNLNRILQEHASLKINGL